MPLLALGPHVFEIAPLNFQAIDRETTVKWPAIPRFGGRPGRQMTGYGEDPITISGMLFGLTWSMRGQDDNARRMATKMTQADGKPIAVEVGKSGWPERHHMLLVGKYTTM